MKYLISLSILLLCLGAFSQKKVFNPEFEIPKKTPVYLSYFGNLGVHPGVKGGFEYSLFFKEKTKEKKRKIKTIRKTLIISPSVGFYSHKNSHKGLLISGDLIWRRYTKRLFINDLSLGFGYFRKFNSGTTYEVTSGGVEEIGGSSRGYFTPSLGYSFGTRFIINEKIPTEFFTKINYHFLLNYNSSAGIEITAELGLRMALNVGINQEKVTKRIKNKLK